MSKLESLRQIKTKHELAALLGVKATTLTYVLYVLKPATQYTSFTIPKKMGGARTIFAPTSRLKTIQSSLSQLLLDCIDDINKEKRKENPNFRPTLSHGFVRKKSIFTNATMHLKKKNVLNLDLQDFFGSFNFGRVRGFFIANNHFKLDPHIATVIAQLACYDNKLPQGSPCSPVITNLITHALDIRLAEIARKKSCIYSRYADDITFSTRESTFPESIIKVNDSELLLGKRLKKEIMRAGFFVNDKKTRVQFKDSRQDVTGLVVNEKPNVKNEYWKTVRVQCHSLFKTGSFTEKIGNSHVLGNINVLEGRLNFIDQVDHYNRLRDHPPLNPIYAHRSEVQRFQKHTKYLLSGREKTFSRFLYYRLFYGNTKPTILCEGKTDNIYLKAAINVLAEDYPYLAKAKIGTQTYELLVRFVEYGPRTKFLLELAGGTDYLKCFIEGFSEHYEYYTAPTPQNPVIVILDNDKGLDAIKNLVTSIREASIYPLALSLKDDFRKSDFIHVFHNLYIVLTPLNTVHKYSDIESLFDEKTLLKHHNGKCFNTVDKRDIKIDLSKESFATNIIQRQKSNINFSGFKCLLDRIVAVIDHYDSIQ